MTASTSAGSEAATLDEGQRRDLVELIGDFASREVAPRVAEYDREERLPIDLLERMAGLGFFGGVIPVEQGGLGLDYVTFAQLVEEISRTCQILGTLVSMPSGLVGASIAGYGTAEQQQRWLRPLAQGEIFGAAAVTEPQSGSDVAGMRTSYRRYLLFAMCADYFPNAPRKKDPRAQTRSPYSFQGSWVLPA